MTETIIEAPKQGKIFAAICAIMSEIGAIGKEKRNSTQNFNYRGIDDVYNMLQPLMAKHKVFVIPDVLEHNIEERASRSGGINFYHYTIERFTFVTDDGSSISCVMRGEAMDSGDKGLSKTYSIAQKYAVFQMFMIPTEELAASDPDGHAPEPTVESKKATPPPSRSTRTPKPAGEAPKTVKEPEPPKKEEKAAAPAPAEAPAFDVKKRDELIALLKTSTVEPNSVGYKAAEKMVSECNSEAEFTKLHKRLTALQPEAAAS